MGQCKDCVHWGRNVANSFDFGEFSKCYRVLFDEYGESSKSDQEAADNAVYWEEAVRPIRQELAVVSGDVANLRTRSTFGCVLWEAK